MPPRGGGAAWPAASAPRLPIRSAGRGAGTAPSSTRAPRRSTGTNSCKRGPSCGAAAEPQGHLGGETIERFALLLGGMLTEWASWRWVMYVNVAFAAPALIGALLLAKPVISKGRAAVLDNLVQNRLGF